MSRFGASRRTMRRALGGGGGGGGAAVTVYRADYLNGDYILDGVASTLGAVQATTRASAHLFHDTSDVIASFANDNIARTNRGAYIAGSVVPLVKNASDLTGAAWSNVSVSSTDLGDTALGLFKRVSIAGTGATWNVRLQGSMSVTASQVYRCAVLVQAGTSGKVAVNIRNAGNSEVSSVSGTLGALAVTNVSNGAISNLTETLLADGVTRLITFLHTNKSTQSVQDIQIGPNSSTNGQTVIALGAQYSASVRPLWPFVDSGASLVTRAASVVQAVQASSKPFAGWSGNSLDAGFGIAFAARVPDTGATAWPVCALEQDASNYVRVYFLNGHLYCDVRAAGSTQTFNYNTVTYTADQRVTGLIELRADRFTMRANSIAHVDNAAPTVVRPTGLTKLHHGRDHIAGTHFDGIIENIEIQTLATAGAALTPGAAA